MLEHVLPLCDCHEIMLYWLLRLLSLTSTTLVRFLCAHVLACAEMIDVVTLDKV